MAEHRLSYTAEEIDERLGTVNDNKQNILNLTNRVVENENDIDAVEANVSTLSAEMSTAKTDIDNLETQVTTNKQNIDTNATAIQTNATAISDLNTNLSKVDTEVSLINHTFTNTDIQTNVQCNISYSGYKLTDFRGLSVSLIDNTNKIVINPVRVSLGSILLGYWIDNYITVSGTTIRIRIKYVDETHLIVWCNVASNVIGVSGIL